MSNKPKKNVASKRNKRILVSAVAIFLVLISILAYISSTHQAQPPVKQKVDSSTYFAISDLAGLFETRNQNQTTPGASALINQLGFSFTPIGGNATDVIIFMAGNSDPLNTDWEGITITNGTATPTGELTLPHSIPCARNSDGTYPLKVRIQCQEANGWVTLNFTADDLFAYYNPV